MMLILRLNHCRSFPFALLLVLLSLGSARGQSNPPTYGSIPVATFDQLSAEAKSSREAGRVDDAIGSYQGALKLQPDWAEGWWYLGTLNYDADRYPEAILALQKLVGLNPQMGPALAFLGLAEFETKAYNNSLVHLQQARRFGYGDDAELAKVATYHLALLLNLNGEFEKTVELFDQGVGRNRPPDEIKVALGMALLRIPLLAREVDPGNDALILAAGEAAVLLENGNSAAAAEEIRQLLVEYPKIPCLHYAYATALEATGEYDNALREFTEEIRLSPRSALPYIGIASLSLQLHNAKEALPSSKQAVLLAPQSAAAHDVLARTLKQLGEIQGAAKELAVVKKLESSPTEVDITQRQFYLRSSAAESAVQRTTITATNSEDGFEALAQRAEAAQAAGPMDATMSFYERALVLRPGWEEGWRKLATLYYASARYPDAIAAFKNSTAIDAHNGNVWALLGLSEFETKDYKNSLIHLERGRELGFAGNAAAVHVAQYHLAVLLNRNGDFDRATELLTSEPGSGHGDEQIKFALGMALLRIPLFPDELDHSKDSLVRLAGETAALLSESKYDLAFADFQQLLKINFRTPYLHYAYGCALASASRFDEAEEQLAEETKISPESALPFLRRGSIALQLRRADNAVQFAQQAVQLAPDSAEGRYLLGRSWLELGRTGDSVKELEIARGLVPNSPEVRFSLARAYAKAGQAGAAEQERAAFERLNALVQSQRNISGSQAYGAIQNQTGIRTAEEKRSDQTQVGARPK